MILLNLAIVLLYYIAMVLAYHRLPLSETKDYCTCY
jgi:hypothetical protein